MPPTSRKTNIELWTAQAVLAAPFIFGGSYKLAAGLSIIMAGAAVTTVLTLGFIPAIFPLVVGA